MASRGHIEQVARDRGLSRAALLRKLFRQYKTVSAVARSLGVNPSTVTVALQRERLEIHVTLRRVKYLRGRVRG